MRRKTIKIHEAFKINLISVTPFFVATLWSTKNSLILLKQLVKDEKYERTIKNIIPLGSFTFSILLFTALLTRMNTPLGIIEYSTIQFLIILGTLGLGIVFAIRISFSQASNKELKIEDDIILQAIAFSQSALWIYLNILPATESINAMKGIVPTAAIVTYGIRAYAKLKNNNVWRYRSTYAVAVIVGISFYSFIWALLGPMTGFSIDGIDVTKTLISNQIAIVALLIMIVVGKRIRTRYVQDSN